MRKRLGSLAIAFFLGCGAPDGPAQGGGDGGGGGGGGADAGGCIGAACPGGPCGTEALAQSYMGCIYYATDLPQWGQSTGAGPIMFGTIAANQQFAIAVANPWPDPVDVVVEQNEATPGEPPIIAEVTRATVAPESLLEIPLPQREVNGYIVGVQQSRSLITSNAYRVTTSLPTSVYQFNPQNNPDAYSNDASLLIPVNALDENYVALGWPGMGGFNDPFFMIRGDNRSFLTIVSARANNHVRVIPSTHVMPGDNVAAMAPGEELVFTLGEFETLTLQGADYDQHGWTDFSGTRIQSDGPLAVWSGAECINVNPPDFGGCCCDHLEEQLYPRSSLSTDYVAVRSQSRAAGGAIEPDYWRILALSDATAVTTSLPAPDDSFMLNRGEQRQILTTVDFKVSASAPVMLGQFLLSQDNAESLQGDPGFILHPPIDQHRQRYIFLVPSGYGSNHLQLSTPPGVLPVLDGAPLVGCTRVSLGDYDAVRCPVTGGSHTIEAEAPFGLVVTGVGPGPVSYGYTGGMDFNPVNEDCVDDSECGSGEFCSGGECVDIID